MRTTVSVASIISMAVCSMVYSKQASGAESASSAHEDPTSMPVVAVSSTATILGAGVLVAGIVQADAGNHPFLLGTGLGVMVVGVPAAIASLTADDPSTMSFPGAAAGGVAAMAVGAGAIGTGVVALGGAREEPLGTALLVGGATAWVGGLGLTLVGNHDDPERAARRATEMPEQAPEPGSMTTSAEVGRVMTFAGIGLVAAGAIITAVAIASGEHKVVDLDNVIPFAVGVGTISVGGIVAIIGGTLWAAGTASTSSTSLTVGPGSVDLRGSF